jgi:serine/threonine-protein kinase RsbW
MNLSEELLQLELPCDDHAPSAVRQALSDVSDASWAIGDAMLVASELVTNAIRHSGCAEDHDIQVSFGIRDERLLIAVCDPGFSGRAAQIRNDPAFGGLGLQIVAQLAHKWGSERTDGYRVWAEVQLSA